MRAKRLYEDWVFRQLVQEGSYFYYFCLDIIQLLELSLDDMLYGFSIDNFNFIISESE